MFLRLLFESFRRQKRRKTVALVAIALGMSIATAMIAVGTDIGDKINQELRSLGANLVITPEEDTLDVNIGGVDLKPASEGAFLQESDLTKIKGIFWRHNIRGYAPFLSMQTAIVRPEANAPVEVIGTYFAQALRYGNERYTTGVRSTNPWWQVQGEWPPDYAAWPDDQPPAVLAGSKLAAEKNLQMGNTFLMEGHIFRISGILSTGGAEDSAIVAPIHLVQLLAHRPGAVRKVLVSALTKPEDAFARKDPTRFQAPCETAGIVRRMPIPLPIRSMKRFRMHA